jgi:large subunit ribosomal protein L28
MARRCDLTGKETIFGHNVSKARNRTNRRFIPNLQKVTLHSDAMRCEVKLRICTRALRSVQTRGGLDAYLLSRLDDQLPVTALRLKRKIKKALSTPKKANKAA